MEVIARGPRITIKVNDVTTVNDFEDPLFRFRQGHLMLQQGGAETVVAFRKIEIKELPGDGSASAAPPDGTSSPLESGSGAATDPAETGDDPAEQDTAVSEASLREAIRLKPRYSETHKRLGQFLERQNRLSEAEAAFREAIRLAPGEPNYHACLSAVLRKQPDRYSEGIEELELANRLGPDQCYILNSLGHAYARWGRWQEAAPLYRRASELEPTEKWYTFKSATLSLYLGDVENYRLACRRLLDADKPGDEDRRPYNTAIACLLTPDGIGESERVRQIAFDELTPARDNRYAGNARALAELRAGEWRAAMEELRPPVSKLGSHWRDVFPLVVMAMAQQGSGDLPAAQQTLAKAKALRDASRPVPEQGQPFVIWQEWLQAEILLREAEGLIAPQTKVEPAR
jgi:tetratricopeptide (TPR) repeat protein